MYSIGFFTKERPSKCKLEGCNNNVYVDPSGREMDFCGRSHATQYAEQIKALEQYQRVQHPLSSPLQQQQQQQQQQLPVSPPFHSRLLYVGKTRLEIEKKITDMGYRLIFLDFNKDKREIADEVRRSDLTLVATDNKNVEPFIRQRVPSQIPVFFLDSSTLHSFIQHLGFFSFLFLSSSFLLFFFFFSSFLLFFFFSFLFGLFFSFLFGLFFFFFFFSFFSFSSFSLDSFK